jgi:hypothetical protein
MASGAPFAWNCTRRSVILTKRSALHSASRCSGRISEVFPDDRAESIGPRRPVGELQRYQFGAAHQLPRGPKSKRKDANTAGPHPVRRERARTALIVAEPSMWFEAAPRSYGTGPMASDLVLPHRANARALPRRRINACAASRPPTAAATRTATLCRAPCFAVYRPTISDVSRSRLA